MKQTSSLSEFTWCPKLPDFTLYKIWKLNGENEWTLSIEISGRYREALGLDPSTFTKHFNHLIIRPDML